MKKQKNEKRAEKDFLRGSIVKRHLAKSSSKSAEAGQQDYMPPRFSSIH